MLRRAAGAILAVALVASVLTPSGGSGGFPESSLSAGGRGAASVAETGITGVETPRHTLRRSIHPPERVEDTAQAAPGSGHQPIRRTGLLPPVGGRSVKTKNGKASTYGPGWTGWIAWPQGPGYRLLVCGKGGCETVVSTDAGPDLAMQRAGRIIDLDVSTFEAVCGVPWTAGLCRVTVAVLR